MRILILEPGLSGHHAAYLRWLLEATSRRGWATVLATTSAAEEQPVLRHVLADFNHVELHRIEQQYDHRRAASGVWSLWARDLQFRKMFRIATKRVGISQRIDGVLLPYLDYCFYSISMLGAPFGRIPWCAISMRLSVPLDASEHKSLMPRKWRLAMRLLGNEHLRALFVINPSVARLPTAWCPPELRRKLVYLPDPARLEGNGDRDGFRAKLGISADALVILVLGAIDERKGVDVLIDCLATDAALNAYSVVIAGRVAENVRIYLESSVPLALGEHRRLFVIDRFLEDSELPHCLSSADAVWLGYTKHNYMSGVLVLAGIAGLPVVGTKSGEIGDFIERYQMGVSVDVNRTEDLAAGLRRLLDGETRRCMGSRGRKAFAAHTVENFGDLVLDAFAKP
jgi:glycosyltransferase involved in cell wall biosynthesis